MAPQWLVGSSRAALERAEATLNNATPRTPLKAIAWQIQAPVHADDTTIAQDKHAKACYVLGPISPPASEALPKSSSPTTVKRTLQGAVGFSMMRGFSSRRGSSKNRTGLKGCSW